MAPKYIQWTILSLLYHTRRKNPSEYKGLIKYICLVNMDEGPIWSNCQLSQYLVINKMANWPYIAHLSFAYSFL